METSASLLDLWTLQRPENISEMCVYGSGYYSAVVKSKVMFALMTLLFQKLKWMKKKSNSMWLGWSSWKDSCIWVSQLHFPLGFRATQHTIPAIRGTPDLQRTLSGIYHPPGSTGVRRLKWDIFKTPSESFDVCRKTLTAPDVGLLQVSVFSCGLLVGNEAVFSIQLFWELIREEMHVTKW